jgi:hypothetical protein
MRRDDDTNAAAALEKCQHHVAEDATRHAASGIDTDDVTRLGVIQGVAMQLSLRPGILVLVVDIVTLRHELQGQSRPGDDFARIVGCGALDGGIVDSKFSHLASGGRSADLTESIHEFLWWTDDVGCMRVGFGHEMLQSVEG